MGDVAKFLFMPIGLGGYGIDLTKSHPLAFWTGDDGSNNDNNNNATPVSTASTVNKTPEISVQDTSTRTQRASSIEMYQDSLKLGNEDKATVKKKTLLGD